MTYVVAATNNVILRGEDVDWRALLAVAEIADQHLEDNREAYSQHLTELMIFGHSTMRLSL